MTGKPGNWNLKSILKNIQARIKMQTLKADYANWFKKTKQGAQSSQYSVGSLQVAGGHRGTASPVRPDFCVLPLLSGSPAKWGRGGPATLWSHGHRFWPWQHSPEHGHLWVFGRVTREVKPGLKEHLVRRFKNIDQTVLDLFIYSRIIFACIGSSLLHPGFL